MIFKKRILFQFHEPDFARFPNGVIVHPECAGGGRVCPVTGRLFSSGAKETKS